ncbi:uncharacterized protein N7482_009306 [Penicillium canariense]|uniref:Transcription initiation factor IIF subunit alpha n=1 Tax=Penicillium canariense TaxID=189055 RepID=A0A9W9LFQ1_9EURO|nr:uncharacterized protein N7482_009306 [Penicillium canariense]KAJ5152828.1 hypothetical protein N7482_009306 [Penicillium canariense]
MSTPTNASNGRTPTGSNGVPPMRIRRPKAADPLVRPKRRLVKPPGAAAGGNTATKTLPARPSAPGALSLAQPERPRPPPVQDEHAVNGFSGPLLSQKYVDYPLVTTKKALREGLKHHIARFSSKRPVDPRDESQFTRPVRLHRRDPRARTHDPHAEKMVGPDGQQLDEAEREALDARRAAREKERAQNMAQIAPAVGSSAKRPNAPKQKTQQVFKSDMTKEEIARARIKYEEALPWHIEDFDNRNIYVGNYEAALSETHAVFVLENTGRMRMIPAEKWYKFSAKQQFKALTIEEAEKYMAKRSKDPRWFMEKQQEIQMKKELDGYAQKRRVYAGKQGGLSGREGLEASEMDFEEDRFADDEEHADLFNEQDEDTKAAEQRIKEDQLKANVFDLKEEKDYEDEEEREKKEREARRVLGKKVRKALKKRERNFDYSSGSDVNPYTDEESSDDSEAERQKEEERKKEEEQKAEEEKNQKDSATSTKGSNTPSGRPKHTDALKKPSGSRKRLGSPGSDASGTDSSRKKPKNKHPTSQPVSRPISPSATSQAGKKRIRNNPLGGPGSGSDIDIGAGSGGEMSESGKTKKLKLNLPSATSRGGTPQGSRAASPVAGNQSFSGAGRSTPAPSGNQSFPTPAEIHAAIPATGILSSDLLRIFRPRIGESRENHRRFIAIVKDVSSYGKEDRMLRPGSWSPN